MGKPFNKHERRPHWLVRLSFLFLASPSMLWAQGGPASLPNVRLSTGGAVYAMVAQTNGGLFIGGRFSAVNGVARHNLARLTRDGSVDLAWDPNITYSGAADEASVEALAASGEHLYVGGSFDHVGGEVRLGFARVDAAGLAAVDTNWRPQVENVVAMAIDGTTLFAAGIRCTGGGGCRQSVFRIDTDGGGEADESWNPHPEGSVENPVWSLAVQGGYVFVGGSFTRIGGLALARLAKLNASTGVPDPAWAPAPDDTVFCLATVSGTLYAGGSFSRMGGSDHNLVARLAVSTGSVDDIWDPEVNGDYVLALLPSGDSIYVGGLFETIGGLRREGVAKISVSGTGEAAPNWDAHGGLASEIIAVAQTSDGLYVGGAFARFNGSLALGLARLDPEAGRKDAVFPVQVERPGAVNALVRQPDGKLVVGGSFLLADGLERPNLVRLNPDYSVERAWNPEPNAEVLGLALSEAGLFVCGRFTRIGGEARNHIAKLGVGGSDAAEQQWNPDPDFLSFVHGLVVSGTNLFVRGEFERIGGLARSGLAKLSVAGTGEAHPTWDPSPDGPITSFATEGTNLFVAGPFARIGGLDRDRYAKLSLTGTGAADAAWNPQPLPAGNGDGFPYEPRLVLSGSNVFVSGYFTNIGGLVRTNLAKLNTTGFGLADATWNPHPVDAALTLQFGGEIRALAATESDLFVAGHFEQIGGRRRSGLAKLDVAGAGLADQGWSHAVGNGSIRTMLANGKDLLVGGDFDRVDEQLRYALALLAVADPPTLLVEPGPRLRVLRNLADGPEVTHFLIVSSEGGVLLRPVQNIPVRDGESISVAEGAVGLSFSFSLNSETGRVTVASALNDLPNGVGSSATALISTNTSTPQVVTFSFSQAAYVLKEGGGAITVQVLKQGPGAASVRYTTLDGTANAGPDYQARSGVLNFTGAETQKSLPAINVVNDFSVEGDEVFAVQLLSPITAILVEPALTVITIQDDDGIAPAESCLTNVVPTPRPAAGAAVAMMLEPAAAFGRWRLAGGEWLNSAEVVIGLPADNHLIEFQPVPGYLEPGRRFVPVEAGRTNVFSASYALAPALGAGDLIVILEPGAIATNPVAAARGQWRRQGEIVWHDSGEVLAGLSAGAHVIEFKPVPDRATPAPRLCQIGAGQENVVSASYLYAFETGAPAPHVLSLAEADTEPYLYCGQLRTPLGAGSGTVVKSRVVLTAAHVLFDELQFTYVTDARWMFQRHRGDYEPPAQSPRGWYTFEGYAAQRRADQSPGSSSPASQQLDAAALYFVETPSDPNLPGRGGYSGFLLSESSPSEWLTRGTSKMLVGYPLERISETNQGRLHATAPSNLSFEQVDGAIYRSDDIRSFPGNSGGPLFVEAEAGVGKFFPAGIYLGGLEKTVVRALDADVVDLINRAESSGNGSGNNTGGGVLLWSPGVTTPAFHPGLLGVVLGPPEAIQAGGAWRVRRGAQDVSDYFSGPQLVYPSVPGPVPVEFRSVPGFLTPPSRLVTVYANETNRIPAYYLRPPSLRNETFEAVYPGRTGRVYKVETSTNLLTWHMVKLLTNRVGEVRYTETLTPSAEAPARFFRVTEQP